MWIGSSPLALAVDLMCPHTWIQAETGIVEKLALSGKCTAHYPKEGGVHYSLLNDVRAVRVRACVRASPCV